MPSPVIQALNLYTAPLSPGGYISIHPAWRQGEMWHSCIRRNMGLLGRSYNRWFIVEERGKCTAEGEVINMLYPYQYSQSPLLTKMFCCLLTLMILYHKISMDIYILFISQKPLCIYGSVAIFICSHAPDRSARFTRGKEAEAVICSAVVTNSSSRLDSFTTISSQQSPTCLIVDLSDVWELYYWLDSRVCEWLVLQCLSCALVCVCLADAALCHLPQVPKSVSTTSSLFHLPPIHLPGAMTQIATVCFNNTFPLSACAVPLVQRQTQRQIQAHLLLLYIKTGLCLNLTAPHS